MAGDGCTSPWWVVSELGQEQQHKPGCWKESFESLLQRVIGVSDGQGQEEVLYRLRLGVKLNAKEGRPSVFHATA